MSKGLKPAIPRRSARDALAAVDALAQQTGLPPATVAPKVGLTRLPETRAAEDLVQVNIRVRRQLGDQLADRARSEGTTQKVLICRALAAAGFDVHQQDLHLQPLPRRRGSL